MTALSTVLEVAGLILLVAAAALFDVRLGMAVGGLVLVLVGMAADPPRRRAVE